MGVTVLVVDEETVGLTLRRVLEAEGYGVALATGLPEALAKLERTPFDVLVLDLHLGGADGVSVLGRLRARSPGAVGIILTGGGSLENALRAMRTGADDFLVTPSDRTDLKASISRALQRRAQAEARARLVSREQTARADADAARAAALDRLKEEFITTASHDLKGPLTSIRGYAQLLLRRVRAPAPNLHQLVQGLTEIDAQTAAMARLLDDLLDASRLQDGRLQLRTAPCDLGACLDTVLARLNPQERARVDVALSDAPLAGEWEPQRIEQVLANLVGNALKYSPERERVSVTVDRRAREIEVAVGDRGMGIPPEERPRLFGRFHRTPQALASGLSGTGLGLYIAQGIVAAHGGRIWVESPGEGQGSTFRFTVPVAPPESGGGSAPEGRREGRRTDDTRGR